MSTEAYTPEIAVIGMGCWYPGARDLRQLWENILSRRRQFRQIPDQRLPLSEYYDPDPTAPDKTYGNRTAVIDGFEFDWAGKRIPKTAFESTDIAHWLALEVALKALENAGYTRDSVPNERSGVVLGNTLTGEQTRSNMMRLRWPYVRRVLRAAMQAKGLAPQFIAELVETMEEYYKSVFPPTTEDTLAGGLSNTIAGRICNFLNFHGGGYTVDGACSSSLIAVATAANALCNDEVDLALAGGVDISLDTFELIGFAKAGALTRQGMTVYDRKASGFIPGEGCGFVVLKRLEDARQDGNYVYAVLRGWGISSDGRGGITAPSREGQAIALLRAYARAGYSPRDVAFIEGHGTGTPVGDRTELEAIALAMASDGEPAARSCGVTSFKSIVGHTKAAAGVGGFIKAIMAVNRRVLPPIAGCKEPNAVFDNSVRCAYPILQGEVRSHKEKIRAGVSAMGFGGINCHVTLESGDAPSPSLEPSVAERALLASNQETELFVLATASISALLQRTQEVMRLAEGMSVGELVDLAADLVRDLEPRLPMRAVVIAGTPEELLQRFQQLEKMLRETPPSEGEMVVSPQKEVWLGNAVQQSRIGFLFPGQGSGQLNMARTLVERYSWARELVEQADQCLREVGAQPVSQFIFRSLERAVNADQSKEWSAALAQTEVAQPAICLASLLWTRWLKRLGVRPVVVTGHSLGELTAFHVAGAFDDKALLSFAAIRGQAMTASANNAGIMASLACSRETTEGLLKQVSGYAVIANINSPRQVVISGERTSIEEAINLAAADGIQTYQLPVSNAFHSQLVSAAAEYLHTHAPIPELLGDTSVQLLSSMDGQKVTRGLKLREHFANQVLSQVNFIAAVKKLAQECDLIVEVGPGKVLSGLVKNITASGEPLCLPIESKSGLDRDWNTVLASLFVHGSEINWEALYQGRLVRPFVPASQRIFIENPCERPFKVSNVTPFSVLPAAEPWSELKLADAANVSPQAVSQVLFDYLSQRGSFLAEVVRADLQNLPSLSTPHNSTRKSQETWVSSTSINKVPKREETVRTPIGSRKTEAIEEVLIDLVAQRTGYPQESITLEARLLDDLNLDSIKAGELVAAVAKECGVAGKVDPSTLANVRLREVIEAVRNAAMLEQDLTINNRTASSKPTLVSQASKVKTSIPNLLLELVEQRTGFPQNTLSMSLCLLDDLNLDSIKAAEFVAEAAKRVGVEGRLDPSQFANVTLAEVAQTLQQLAQEDSAAASDPAVTRNTADPATSSTISTIFGRKSWVRDFVIQYVAEEDTIAPAASLQDAWKTANVLILSEPEEIDMTAALVNELESRGAHAQIVSFIEAYDRALIDSVEFSHLIAVHSRTPSNQLSPGHRLQEMIGRLHTVATLRGQVTLAHIQFGGGYFGTRPQVADIEQCCATAFAASIHLERPDLKVRVVDLATNVDPVLVAGHVINDLATAEAYLAVGYDAQLTRRVPKPLVQNPAEYKKRKIHWSANDVILVTGGAKGITAECALALAQATGVRMALVGTSLHPQADSRQKTSAEIARTLDRFSAAGLTCQYYSCDITDPDAVTALSRQIRQELGQITGVIHGAGLNKPRRVEQVSAEAAYLEVSPKVLGAINLCQALQNQPPKLFVGFSSVIGVIGMPGNAWYGFANEALDLILRRFEEQHPETFVLSVAYSVWDEVGMGARMNSVQALTKMGIDAIPKKEGVRRFLHLIENDPGSRQVIVAARDSLDTWRPKPNAMPAASRFLEQLRYVEPGVEVISRVHLSLERDAYVQEHVYKGSYLFPTVFGLEAMAQTVAYATGQSSFQSLCIENIRLERPIVVDPDTGVDIEIYAEVLERESHSSKQRVLTGIRTERTGFAMDHFSATFVLDVNRDTPRDQVELPQKPLDIQPQQDLYGWLLFQGSRFQRLRQVYTLNSKKCVFRSEVRPCSSYAEEAWLLGDPFFRDSLLQSVQLMIPQDICLPVRIDSIELYPFQSNLSELCVGTAINEGRSGQDYNTTVFVITEDGRVVERLNGYQLRILEHRPANPTAEDLADPSQRDEQILLRELSLRSQTFKVTIPEASVVYLPGLHSLSGAERHQQELPVFYNTVAKVLGCK